MMTRLLTILFTCCLKFLPAQDSIAPSFIITTDTFSVLAMDSLYLEILVDQPGEYSIQDISGTEKGNRFIKLNQLDSSNFNAKAYWLRYRVKNGMPAAAKFSIASISPKDDIYYSFDDISWTHLSTGRHVPLSKKDGLKKGNQVPFLLPVAEEVTIYHRILNQEIDLNEGLFVGLYNTDQVIQYFYIDPAHFSDEYFSLHFLIEMFLEGLLILAFLFNLFFYLNVREKEYLYFSLFLLSLFLARTINFVYLYFSREHPAIVDQAGWINLFWCSILFFLVQFTRSFFRLHLRYRNWSIFLLISAVVSGSYNLWASIFINPCFYCSPLTYPLVYYVYVILTFFVCTSVLITFLIHARKRDQMTKMVILGGTPLLLLWGLGVLLGIGGTLLRYVKDGNFPPWAEWFYLLYRPVEVFCVMWFVVFFSLILFIRLTLLRKENQQQALDKEILEKQKETEKRELIEKQKIILEEEVILRTAELKKSIEDLTSTQKQLIQSEKMASLGELTAGIAHEIQNPLNFVNNFSEVNAELIDELNAELAIGNMQQAREIGSNIKENEEKILFHGKRADAIVKGMLQHSRISTGIKEPTDINALADEYLRLAYHGLRAKDKSFNATIKTDYDPSIGLINIIPQDIGRVILNLITNAFYVVNEKKMQMAGNYEPTVEIMTRKLDDKIEIRVSDNGHGIPQNVIDKIFQPFFTTKPSGEGTGLGLSLSYDIVKSHGGELKVENEGRSGNRNDHLIAFCIIKK